MKPLSSQEKKEKWDEFNYCRWNDRRNDIKEGYIHELPTKKMVLSKTRKCKVERKQYSPASGSYKYDLLSSQQKPNLLYRSLTAGIGSSISPTRFAREWPRPRGRGLVPSGPLRFSHSTPWSRTPIWRRVMATTPRTSYSLVSGTPLDPTSSLTQPSLTR